MPLRDAGANLPHDLLDVDMIIAAAWRLWFGWGGLPPLVAAAIGASPSPVEVTAARCPLLVVVHSMNQGSMHNAECSMTNHLDLSIGHQALSISTV
jgi:hypothetical protein